MQDDAAESGEVEKLTKPGMVDAGTSMSQERLFLMVRFNQIGSLSSLPRGSKVCKRVFFVSIISKLIIFIG